jgi:hypothetical protein
MSAMVAASRSSLTSTLWISAPIEPAMGRTSIWLLRMLFPPACLSARKRGYGVLLACATGMTGCPGMPSLLGSRLRFP